MCDGQCFQLLSERSILSRESSWRFAFFGSTRTWYQVLLGSCSSQGFRTGQHQWCFVNVCIATNSILYIDTPCSSSIVYISMRSTTLQTFRASSTSTSRFGARLVPHCCHQQFDCLWTLLRKAPSNKITDPDHAKGGKPGIQKTQSKRKHRDVVVVFFLQPFSHFQSLSACTFPSPSAYPETGSQGAP